MPIPAPIFDMPMDESTNSPIAYDFGPQQSHAKVKGNIFVPGKVGNAMRNNGDGTAKTRNTHIDLTQDFTVAFWGKNRVKDGHLTPIGVQFDFEMNEASVSSYTHLESNINEWVHWAFVKNVTGVKIYKNGQEVGSVVFAANNMSAFAVRQKFPNLTSSFNYTFDFTFGESIPSVGVWDMDEFLIFDKALLPSEIGEVMEDKAPLLYWIDDNRFTDFEVYVSDSSGLVDALVTKELVSVDWAGEHGQIVDLERPRFMPREITLECFFQANEYMDFTLKMNRFLGFFKSKGTHRLKVEIDRRRPLVYEVYMAASTEIKKKWKGSTFYGTFELKLIEYLPVKRVLRFQKTAVLDTLQINIDCQTPFNIYWGDGTVTENVIGQNLLSHTYSESKIYQIICAGVLEDINAFTHTGILLWSSL